MIGDIDLERWTSMPGTPGTPKPVGSLTLADLAAFPIWEYEDEGGFEGRDETWVRPVEALTVPRRSYVIVAAGFRAACGREFQGSISVSRLEEPAEFLNGVIHARGESYLIPDPENAFFDRAMVALLDGLGLPRPELFPIAFTLRVAFEGEAECRVGVLDGRRAGGDQPGGSDRGQMTFW